MRDSARVQSHSDRPDARAALAELRRKAWETLLDLGLTEEEIVAYYGMGKDMTGAEAAGTQAALRQGIPVR